ncbi:MAG TPA: galactose oxidase-like domain-containing protein, partial [Pyrinomonadaceae bacterium]|nr:galactose oxidase-like domain-containing protein [Pyrinomonadaceae bacterium]
MSPDDTHRSRCSPQVRTLSCGLFLIVIGVAVCWTVAAQGGPSTMGQWSSVQAWPYRAIHAQLLPTGKVMFWDSYEYADFPQLWDPATATITPASPSGYNIFCTSFSFLADGRLLVAGGHISDNVGLSYTSVYDPFANTWTRVANMNAGRWYPTSTTLANGDILTVSGMTDTTVGMNLLPQVWQASSNSWRSLNNSQLQLPYYPYMFLAPNGKVFNAGPNQTTRYLDTSGSGAWTVVGNNKYGSRNWGSAVMYEPGKVLIAGGIRGDFYGSTSAVAPTATAEAIDLNAASPSWQYVASMAYARKHHNLTLLPDGKVLATGGSSGSEDTNSWSASPAYAAEMWDPATNTWTTLASNTVYRGYHATAVLLPDGRVVSAGGDSGGASAEVFSPPYLFNGARPTITAAPTSVAYSQTFFVGTPDLASVTKVTLLSLSSVTHTNNMGQRISTLSFSQASGGLNVTAPSSANQCPPGYYMLFILKGNGVPSVAKIVRIVNTAPTPPAAPTSLTATAASATQINL